MDLPWKALFVKWPYYFPFILNPELKTQLWTLICLSSSLSLSTWSTITCCYLLHSSKKKMLNWVQLFVFFPLALLLTQENLEIWLTASPLRPPFSLWLGNLIYFLYEVAEYCIVIIRICCPKLKIWSWEFILFLSQPKRLSSELLYPIILIENELLQVVMPS